MRRISRAETVYEVDMQGAGEVSAANGPRGRARSGRQSHFSGGHSG